MSGAVDPARPLTRRRKQLAALFLLLVGAIQLSLYLLPNLSRAQTGAQLAAAAFSAVVSLALVVVLLQAGSARRGYARWIARGLLLLFAVLVGLQIYTARVFATYLDEAALQWAGDLLDSVASVGRRQLRGAALVVGPVLVASMVLPLLLGAVAPASPRRGPWQVGAAVLLVALVFAVFHVVPLNPGIAPELLLALSLPRAAMHRHQRGYFYRPHDRDPLPVPRLDARPPRPRSVLLVLNESVRADASCVAFDPACTFTPAVNRLFPERIPLTRLRALDSTTAISFGVLMTGLPVEASEKQLHQMPVLFEYAAAAGWATAYLTSQNFSFGGAGDFLDSVKFTEVASSSTFDPNAPQELGADDRLLLPYAAEKLANLREPFLAVVHLSNTHFNYRIDPADAPFQPTSETLTEETAVALKNRYLDAIHAQDAALGTFFTRFRASRPGKDTVIVYVSDHGESFFERGYGYHATGLNEDEVHVPGWVDAPPGTLTAEETAALRAHSDQPVTLADVAPTVLGLLGIDGDPRLAEYRREMPGRSWLVPPSASPPPIFSSNCTFMWSCAFLVYGALQGPRKYFVRNDKPFCFDTNADPLEQHDLGAAACADLAAFSQKGLAIISTHDDNGGSRR